MRQHYEFEESAARITEEFSTEDVVVKVIKVDDDICEIIKLDMDSLSEILLAAKKVCTARTTSVFFFFLL